MLKGLVASGWSFLFSRFIAWAFLRNFPMDNLCFFNLLYIKSNLTYTIKWVLSPLAGLKFLPNVSFPRPGVFERGSYLAKLHLGNRSDDGIVLEHCFTIHSVFIGTNLFGWVTDASTIDIRYIRYTGLFTNKCKFDTHLHKMMKKSKNVKTYVLYDNLVDDFLLFHIDSTTLFEIKPAFTYFLILIQFIPYFHSI